MWKLLRKLHKKSAFRLLSIILLHRTVPNRSNGGQCGRPLHKVNRRPRDFHRRCRRRWRKLDWNNERFKGFTEPDPSYNGLVFADLGETAFATKLRVQLLRDTGACLSPQNAFYFLLGLETLHLRVERHFENALKVAEYLKENPNVEWVKYPGLPDSPSYELAKKYLNYGSGQMVVFGIKGGREAGRNVINNVKLFSHLANVGDAKSLIIHPASTTHSQLSDEELAKSGTSPEMIRLAIGIEHGRYY